MSKFVSPTGYVDIDNDCEYSIDLKSTRSRESVNPKEDLAFYFQTYLVPKYGLNDINVNNCASFMKELEMNWTKLTPELKDRVLDILVDGIFTNESSYDFKNKFINKLGVTNQPSDTGSVTSKFNPSKSNFGASNNNWIIWVIAFAISAFTAIIFTLKASNKF
jgi:hypothetical protein